MRRLRLLLVFAATVALGAAASAQVPSPTGAAPPAASTAAPTAGGTTSAPAVTPTQQAQADPCPTLDLTKVRVTGVRPVPPFKEQTEPAAASAAVKKRTPRLATGEKAKNLPVVELRDIVAVTVQGLSTLVAREACLEKDGAKRNIVLYLNYRPLTDVVAQPPTDREKDVLMFPLDRTEASREVWTSLLGRPGLDDREVEVSVGVDDQFAVPSGAAVYLRVIPSGWFSFWLVLFGIFLVGFFLLARRSDLLRDPVTPPPGARAPYSLARLQAAWWFFLILAAYLLIGMVTGDFSTSITGTVLVLAGISAGTAAGSAFIDASKTNRVTEAVDSARAIAMKAEMETLDQKAATLAAEVRTGGDPAQAHQLAQMEELRAEKVSQHRKLTNQSESFLLDILSDGNGVNFHRFQALAWTVVLGFIFVGHVYRDLAMPDFSNTLLGLMGISSGTYLSLKIPENPSPAPVG